MGLTPTYTCSLCGNGAWFGACCLGCDKQFCFQCAPKDECGNQKHVEARDYYKIQKGENPSAPSFTHGPTEAPCANCGTTVHLPEEIYSGRSRTVIVKHPNRNPKTGKVKTVGKRVSRIVRVICGRCRP